MQWHIITKLHQPLTHLTSQTRLLTSSKACWSHASCPCSTSSSSSLVCLWTLWPWWRSTVGFERRNQLWSTCLTWRVWICSSPCCCLWRSTTSWTLQIGCSVRRRVRVLSAAYYCYMYCSILLMMCMSVDRLLAVVFPITSLTWRSTRKATFICTLVWLLAFAGTVPLLSMSQTVKTENVGITCHDVLHQNGPTVVYYVYVFSILSCLYFFLPLVVTFVSYSTIIYALSTKSDRLTTSSSSSDNRKRAVIMAVAVLTEFVVCFAPTNGILLYHCVHLANGGHYKGDSSYAAYLLAVCFGSASVFLDPLLYYYGSSQCRQQIRSVFWCKKPKKRTKLSNIWNPLTALQLHSKKRIDLS